jgi:rsbT co-antagonist protein RsbR
LEPPTAAAAQHAGRRDLPCTEETTIVSAATDAVIPRILKTNEAELLDEWLKEQLTAFRPGSKISETELRGQSKEFLNLLQQATQAGHVTDIQAPSFGRVRDMLGDVSRSRGLQGFSPSETATFVLSLKRPLFARIRTELGGDADTLATVTWSATELFDKLGLYTTEVYQKSREEVIKRQQQELLELSTPVVKLWDGILALPMIGTLDSARTQIVMESLLQRIVETGADIAIIDITGVPTVDTLTAQHLLKTVTAARLMGADCIISGIRPQIAQTIVHLGVDLGAVITKATLADAFRRALEMTGQRQRALKPRA